MLRAILGSIFLIIGWLVAHGAWTTFMEGTSRFPLPLEVLFFGLWMTVFLGGGVLLFRRWAMVSAIVLLALCPFWLVASAAEGLRGRTGTSGLWLALALVDMVLGAGLMVLDLLWLRKRRPRT